jgi:CBS-domain-containing membrane protein
MPLGLALLIAIVTGALGARKGYNFFLWALAAGVLGLIILAFLPFANQPDQSPEEQRQLRRTGNTVAGLLAILAAVFVAIRFAAS